MSATRYGVVVAGGCLDAQPGAGAYSCVEPSDTIDVLLLKSSDGATLLQTSVTGQVKTRLSSARAWASACAANDAVVVAGGGTTQAKSAAGDLINVFANGTVTTFGNTTALSAARWGVACATAGVADLDENGAATGEVAYFGGGIGGPHSDYLPTIDAFDGTTWRVAPFALSQARESTGAIGTGDSVSFLGGWNELLDEPNLDIVDTFRFHEVGDDVADASTSSLDGPAYWPGGTFVSSDSDEFEFAVDNGALNSRADADDDWTTTPLPDALSGPPTLRTKPYESGGAIPGEHVPQNGVAIGCLACFYGAAQQGNVGGGGKSTQEEEEEEEEAPAVVGSPAVHCFNSQTRTWLDPLPCSARHKAGGIAAVGDTIFVAAGYDPLDPNNAPTDVVDVFTGVAQATCA